VRVRSDNRTGAAVRPDWTPLPDDDGHEDVRLNGWGLVAALVVSMMIWFALLYIFLM
jgi:hypothetical protein